KQNAFGQAGGDGGGLAGDELHGHLLRIGRRGLDVIADAEVEGEVGTDAPVILEEDAVVEVVGVGVDGNVLAHGVGAAKEEVGDGRAATASRSGASLGEGE